MLGAVTRQYLLEKSRVPFQAAGERNYQCFTRSGGAAAARAGSDPAAFWYLKQSGTYKVPGLDDAEEFATLASAVKVIGIADADAEAVFALVADCPPRQRELRGGRGERDGRQRRRAPPRADAALMDRVEKCPTQRSCAHGEVIVVDLTPEAFARDALAKAVYVSLFDWIVGKINDGMASSDESPGFLGLLDASASSRSRSTRSSSSASTSPTRSCSSSSCASSSWRRSSVPGGGRRVVAIEYQDNQGCIDLIEKSLSNCGLDEACKKPNANEKQLCESLATTHKKAEFFLEPRAAGHRQLRSDEAFVVRHFAGNVCYRVAGFLSKNNDTLSEDFLDAMGSSANGVLAAFAQPAAGGKQQGSFNLARRFINDLNPMDDLNSTAAHFVRCIKPNTALKPSCTRRASCCSSCAARTIDARG